MTDDNLLHCCDSVKLNKIINKDGGMFGVWECHHCKCQWHVWEEGMWRTDHEEHKTNEPRDQVDNHRISGR